MLLYSPLKYYDISFDWDRFLFRGKRLLCSKPNLWGWLGGCVNDNLAAL